MALALLLSVTTNALAQGAAPAQAPPPATLAFPTWEITGGYQFLHIPDENFPIGLNLDGAWNLSSLFGLVAEGGWNYKSIDDETLDEDIDLTSWNLGAGPRVTSRASATFQPYGQVIVGMVHARASTEVADLDISNSDTRFMLQPGGGVNVVAGDGWGVVGAVDYRRVFLNEDEDGESGENEFRVFVGIRMILD
jgi:hypothetical protein